VFLLPWSLHCSPALPRDDRMAVGGKPVQRPVLSIGDIPSTACTTGIAAATIVGSAAQGS